VARIILGTSSWIQVPTLARPMMSAQSGEERWAASALSEGTATMVGGRRPSSMAACS
jgi:hypothetical protein